MSGFLAALLRFGALAVYWREPLMMAQEWQKFASIEAFLSEGVITIAFQKPAESVSSLLRLA